MKTGQRHGWLPIKRDFSSNPTAQILRSHSTRCDYLIAPPTLVATQEALRRHSQPARIMPALEQNGFTGRPRALGEQPGQQGIESGSPSPASVYLFCNRNGHRGDPTPNSNPIRRRQASPRAITKSIDQWHKAINRRLRYAKLPTYQKACLHRRKYLMQAGLQSRTEIICSLLRRPINHDHAAEMTFSRDRFSRLVDLPNCDSTQTGSRLQTRLIAIPPRIPIRGLNLF